MGTLVSVLGRRGLYLLGLLSAAKAAGTVILASVIASAVGALAVGAAVPLHWSGWAAWAVPGLLLRAGAAWALDSVSARAAAGAKEELRGRLAARLLEDGGRSPLGEGKATVLASQGLDALDKYYTQFLPALISCATVPLLVGVRILAADWVSALIIVLTVPLIPLFMALIGWHTQDKVAAAAVSLGRLSNQLVELAKGLPVLVGLGRARAQTETLRRISEDYRTTTMATLRVAFLSAFALELIATLSVAVVAVFIGVRLVGGGLPLETGLLALILAPECYLPLRQLGIAHHASDDGREALAQATAVVDAPAAPDVRRAVPGQVPGPLSIRSLSVSYPGRSRPAVAAFSAELPFGSIAVLEGPSGSGKSTVLAALAGLVQPSGGSIRGADPERVAWIPQHPQTVEPTLAREVALYGAATPRQARTHLAAVGLAALAEAHPGQLSPGELRRLAVARALARIDAGATLLLADEPTAHLDDAAATQVDSLLAGLRGRVSVVLASHRAATRALADVRFPVQHNGLPPLPPQPPLPDLPELPAALVPAPATAAPAGRTGITPEAPPLDATGPESLPGWRSSWRLLRLLQPVRPRFLAAVLASVVATLAGLALTGLSGWLIVRASAQPPILYLLVAIVGVRFFGLLRATARYLERVWLHDAVFGSLASLRIRLWEGLSVRALTHRYLLRGDTAVDSLIGTPDRIRDLAPRAVVPPLAGVLCAAAIVLAAVFLTPADLMVPVLAIQAVVLGGCLLGCPALALAADRRSSTAGLQNRSRVTVRLAALLGAAADLRANRVEAVPLNAVRADDGLATAAANRAAWAQGLAQGLLAAVSGAGAVALLLVCGAAVRAGSMPLENVVAVVLLQLALPDALGPVSGAVQLWPALRRELGSSAALLADDAVAPHTAGGWKEWPGVAVPGLSLDAVSVTWPGAKTPAVAGVSAAVGSGEWLTITGPSGTGKSTLLAAMLGFLPLSRGSIRRGGKLAWCPQQGHLFDSSLRANLLISRPKPQAPEDAELIAALVRVGLGPALAELPDGLDTRLGPGGAYFSGGQRQRIAVARTLLTGAGTILLDEPTAHLDAAAAAQLMADLRAGLTGQAVVLVTHDPLAVAPTDRVLELAGPSVPAGAQRQPEPAG